MSLTPSDQAEKGSLWVLGKYAKSASDLGIDCSSSCVSFRRFSSSRALLADSDTALLTTRRPGAYLLQRLAHLVRHVDGPSCGPAWARRSPFPRDSACRLNVMKTWILRCPVCLRTFERDAILPPFLSEAAPRHTWPDSVTPCAGEGQLLMFHEKDSR